MIQISYILKIEIRNTEIYSSEVSVFSTMGNNKLPQNALLFNH